MTVYDRVIPNDAIESLIALTVGVVIALSFDFLIRYIRALFVAQPVARVQKRAFRN